MSETCKFSDVEFEIEEQIILGGNSSKRRKRALRDPTFDLKSMLLEGRRDEQSKYQAQQIEPKEQTDGEANKLEQKPDNGNISNSSNIICRNCGRAYPHTGACPAKGKTCNNCGKPNHFGAVCRGKQKQTRSPRYSNKKHEQRNLKTLDTGSNSSSDKDYLYTMTNTKHNDKVNVTVGGAKFQTTIGSGATINVIDRDTFNKMQDIKLTRTNTKAFAYNTKSPVEFWKKSKRFALNGAKFFSKHDLSQAYHQLELDEQSRYITTFSTHVGLYRYKRLNYGTNAAAEIFQYTLQTALKGIKGVKNIADDIIVFGSTRTEHDANLDKCLQRLAMKGLRLNRSKCNFLSATFSFFKQVFSKEGTHPDPRRVADLLNAPQPNNEHEVSSFLGMVNYSIDASPVGISGILSQKPRNGDVDSQQIIAYASRALTDTEKRYSQTEKEALAIVWAVEHFHLFLFGSEFTLITDHEPLEIIYGQRTAKTSARIERWVLRFQPYTFKIIYKSGASNPADYLSRHPTNESKRKQEK
ncbi:Retrovirus-related Pol poly from transposon [Paramuricea clavata]|uniref:Retrovirus-related Pol poly from transposon n=1 Tax=Paramuricea clavata TaxID=317549 RepID=A0A7D9LNA0_PARCT|nr:Retrovirus-related Pol poly from transposon [Paramuricea clavata]